MFSGLVADLGTVEAVEAGPDGARLRVSTELAGGIAAGDSVAVNGVCLTAVEAGGGGFEAEAVTQTLALTSLGALRAGNRVNLELALRPSDRLGGHIVQGHVDGTAEVLSVTEEGFSRRLRLSLDPGLSRYVVERGSVALDGVSLTVAALGEDWLEVALIPETLARTNLGTASPGRAINLECDLLAKHVERLLSPLAGDDGR
ncbi:MAG: riboflavin synthase [Solirubrobacterales bacterium]